MHTAFKKLLMNLLVMAIIVLPFRMAFSMPLDNAGADSNLGDSVGQHCKHMAMEDLVQDVQLQSQAVQGVAESASQGDCCDIGSSDCTGCANITAMYFDFLQLSDLPGNESFSEMSLSLITRITPPPSRPPLAFHV